MSNPLILHHEKMGATLNPFNAPLSYTDPIDEYWTVKKAAGLADISHTGRLTIAGKDRISFLNSLLTNDLSRLAEGAGQHSALLNTKARVLADLYLYNQPGSVLVDSGDCTASRVKESLDRFVITEDVQIRDSTMDLIHLTVQGPGASKVLKETIRVEVEDLKPLQQRVLGPSLVINRDRTGLGGFDIIVPHDEAEAVWQGFLLQAGDIGLKPVGLKAIETLRIEAGYPRYGVDFSEDTIVLEAGFKDAMSFTKGCYLGQEVVARATHIGRVNRQLVRFEVESHDPPTGRSKLTSTGSDAGFITSAAYSPGLGKTVAIGYANRDFAKEGTKLTVDLGATHVSALVTRIV